MAKLWSQAVEEHGPEYLGSLPWVVSAHGTYSVSLKDI